MDIRTKLVLALVSSALLSMLMLGYLIYLLSFDLLLQNSGRQLDAIVSSKSREILHTIEHRQQDTRRFAAALATLDLTTAQADQTGFGNTLNRAMISATNVRWAGLFDADGQLLLTSFADLAPTALTSSDPVDQVSVIVRQTLAGQLELVHLVRDERLVAAAFSTDGLREIWSDRSGLGETGDVLLIAPRWIDAEGGVQTGYVLLTPGDSSMPEVGTTSQASGLIATALAGGDADRLYSDFAGIPVIASVRALGDTGWRVIVKIDAVEESARVDELLAEMRSLGLSLGALVIFVGIFFGVYLSRRIRRLAETVERVRHGELDLRAEVEGSDEIALLARSLNEFLNQLNRSGDIFQLGALRVLVAEDHAGSRKLLNELLTNWRMRTLLAADADSVHSAIDEAISADEPIQLIVLDESMPEMDGVELVEQLSQRKDWIRCPIILLSRHPEHLDLERLKRLGVGHVVEKPVVASDLMEAILEEMGVSASAIESISDADLFLRKAEPREVLLVEDSPIIQRVTIGFLERWGHRVTLAANGREALDQIRVKRFDLILMDLEMPVMNGLQASHAIREAESEGDRIPIIALTAKATKEDREDCMAAGMNEYVAKPVDPRVLYHLVETYPSRQSTIGTTAPGVGSGEEEGTVETTEADEADGSQSVVDWQIARKLTAGDDSILAELVGLFPDESRRHLLAARNAIAAQDAESLTRAAHSLKSAAGLFAAKTLVALALEVEMMGKAGQISDAKARMADLEAATRAVVEALNEYSPSQDAGL